MIKIFNEIVDWLTGIIISVFMILSVTHFFGWLINNDNNRIENGYHTLVYTVYYPGHPKTYTRHNVYEYKTYSDRGSNTILVALDVTNDSSLFDLIFIGKQKTRLYTIYDGTAPIEIISFKKD